ncbi:MAG: hypothetical protein WC227_03495 [Patescibacteria group bacterium]|jgi:hypothetical protein
MYVTLPEFNNYITKISLLALSGEAYGLIQRTAGFADEVLFNPRRDGRKAVGHSLAVGQESMVFGLSFLAQCVAIGHDFEEDGKLRGPDGSIICISRDYIAEFFGPKYGPQIAFGIHALSIPLEEKRHRELYYPRFLEAAKQWWELLPIRVLDRKVNHLDPYNGDVAKEIIKCEETLGTFREKMEEGTRFIPEDYQIRFAYNLHQTLNLAEQRLDFLKHLKKV